MAQSKTTIPSQDLSLPLWNHSFPRTFATKIVIHLLATAHFDFLTPFSHPILILFLHSVASKQPLYWLQADVIFGELYTASFSSSECHSLSSFTLHTVPLRYTRYTLFNASNIFLLRDVTTIWGKNWKTHVFFNSSFAYFKTCIIAFYHRFVKKHNFPFAHDRLTNLSPRLSQLYFICSCEPVCWWFLSNFSRIPIIFTSFHGHRKKSK